MSQIETPSPLLHLRNPKHGERKPPAFEEAKTRRHKVRSAGLHPDYWYPVCWESELPPGKAIEVVFWKRSIAVYRGEDGTLHALENRCAHRQLKLSLGQVSGQNLTCMYHGWQYDGSGRCAHIPHDLFGNKQPEFKVGTFPLKARYGLVWLFPGDPALASARSLPNIQELEGEQPWSQIALDFKWQAHHSMIIDNVSDFAHAYLHRKNRPFVGAKLTSLEATPEKVLLSYDTQVGAGRFSGLFINRKTTNTNSMKLGYEYPYQWSNTDDKIKHWCFVLPIDERTTRTFFIFYFSPSMLKVPLLPVNFPNTLAQRLVMPIARRVLVRPLLSEDGVAVEAEQVGWEAHHEQPYPELNPAVREFQLLTIRKWEQYLANGAPSNGVPNGATANGSTA